MAIVYQKLLSRLKQYGYTTYRIRKEALIGSATYEVLKDPRSRRGLDHKTVDKLCRVLECQPNDIMEYIPDERLEEYIASLEKKKEGP